jgi:hypothetical protein
MRLPHRARADRGQDEMNVVGYEAVHPADDEIGATPRRTGRDRWRNRPAR